MCPLPSVCNRMTVCIQQIEKKWFLSILNDEVCFLAGWSNVYGFDMSHMRKVAMSEPLVDSIDPKNVVTNSCMVREVDLYQYKVGDSNFKSDFTLKCKKNDYVHAIVCFFDVEFSKCHRRIGFSTCSFILFIFRYSRIFSRTLTLKFFRHLLSYHIEALQCS